MTPTERDLVIKFIIEEAQARQEALQKIKFENSRD